MRAVACCWLAVLGLGMIALVAPAADATPAGQASEIGSWGPGAWSWFADPRAVDLGGKTFVGWIDWDGRVTIGAYDPARGNDALSRYVLAELPVDDHGSPSILVEPDRRLTVFWSQHGGGSIYYRTTRRPADIGAWGPVQRVPVVDSGWLGFTYPTPVYLPGERKLYLFYRGPDWNVDYSTKPWSRPWQNARSLITNPDQRPYVKVTSDYWDTIAFAFTQAHPRDQATSIYYMYYRHGVLRHADGTGIQRLSSPPLAPDRASLVYDARATGVSGWVWDVALRPDRVPVIVYATFPASGNRYWYATWTGSRWRSHFLTFAGPSISPTTFEFEYVGGITIDHADPSTIYLSRKVRGWFELERWTTADGGYRWRRSTVVRTPGKDDVRPFVTEGSNGGPMSLLWLSGYYGSYLTYRTSVDYLR